MMLGNILFLVVIGVVIYMMMKGGGGCCGGHDHHRGHKEHEGHGDTGDTNDTGHAHHHLEAELSEDGPETDPVCGMKVTDNRIEGSHLGRTFHFCSEQCKKVFNLNPHKYAGA